MSLKTAAFLVGVLNDHFGDMAKNDLRIEKRWRETYDEFNATLPEKADERTVEQWERLIYLTGELYYAIAAHGNTFAAARKAGELRAAIEEASQ